MIDGKTYHLAVVLAGIDVVVISIITIFAWIKATIAAESDGFAGFVAMLTAIAFFHALMNEAVPTFGEPTIGEAGIFVAVILFIAGLKAFFFWC